MRTCQNRFTVKGTDEVEHFISNVVEDVIQLVRKQIPSGQLEALVLIGGYGRGEGGVERRAGKEFPHNNLDFLLITRRIRRSARRRLNQTITQQLSSLIGRHGIGIDLSTMSAWHLRHMPCQVMWYDVRHGHKTLLGNHAFLPSLNHLQVDNINPASMRDLLVNRGTLLLINQSILAKDNPSDDDRRTLLKHAIKAVIGYGDAELFFRGQYHWSYQERQRRMASSHEIPQDLRQLYEQAIQFRFQPDYEICGPYDSVLWTERLQNCLQQTHMRCEAIRLGTPSFRWSDYPKKSSALAFSQSCRTPRACLKLLANVMRNRRRIAKQPGISALQLRSLEFRDVLSLAFPVLAYENINADYHRLVGELFGISSASIADLRNAYLRRWGHFGDVNFSTTADRLKLDFKNQGSAA